MEAVVSREAEAFCEAIGELARKGPVQIKEKFAPAIINVVLNLTTGKSTK